MKPQIRKSLMLGLGGAGSRILLGVKKQFHDTLGKIPLCVSFLAIDTDRPDSLSIEDQSDAMYRFDAIESLHLKVQNPADVIDTNEFVHDWYVGEPPVGCIHSGSGAVRQTGRLALVANAYEIRFRLEHIISQLKDMQLYSRLDTQGFALSNHPTAVFIFCSLAGGTGSSILLDIGRLVRNLLPDAFIQGICLSSWLYRNIPFRHRVIGNAQATLDELDDARHTTMSLNQSELRALGLNNASEIMWPFNDLIILDGRNELGAQCPHRGDLEFKAAAATVLLIGPFSSCAEGFSNGHVLQRNGSLPQKSYDDSGYSSFGIAAIYYPAPELHIIYALSLSLMLCKEAIAAEEVRIQYVIGNLNETKSTEESEVLSITLILTAKLIARLAVAKTLIENKLSNANHELQTKIDNPSIIVLGDGQRVIGAECRDITLADFSAKFFSNGDTDDCEKWPESPEKCAQILNEYCIAATESVRDVSAAKAMDILAAGYEENNEGEAVAYLEKIYRRLFCLSAILVKPGQAFMEPAARALGKRILGIGFGIENDAAELHKEAIRNVGVASGIAGSRQIYCTTGDTYRIWLLAIEGGLSSRAFAFRDLSESELHELKKAIIPYYCRSSTKITRHDIFISYRRDGGEHLAGRIKDALKEKGFSAFMDVEDLKSGKFDEALLKKIENANDVLIILTPGCLERCKNEDDWLRREIRHAIKSKRNIVPIMARNFEMPACEALPSDIADLPKFSGLTPAHEMFDESINRLASRFLQSKARKR